EPAGPPEPLAHLDVTVSDTDLPVARMGATPLSPAVPSIPPTRWKSPRFPRERDPPPSREAPLRASEGASSLDGRLGEESPHTPLDSKSTAAAGRQPREHPIAK